MACNNNEYFVGNGEVLIRSVGDDCGAVSSAYRKLGDANELMINQSPSFGNHYESQSGNRVRSARWIQNREVDFTLSVQNFSVENLVDLVLGTDSGAVAGGSIIDEQVAVPATGWVFTTYPGISSVTVTSNSGATSLVLGTDYNLDTRNGGIEILQMTNVTNNEIEVDYTHVGIEGLVEAFQSNTVDVQIRFNGINLNAANKPVIVELHRAQLSGAEEISLIGTEITNLSFTGALLPDGNGDFFSVMKANQV